ncbi:MAG TPA: LytTR family DNA-binding domain-containing protein [Steroidobacteraceae bacterium]|nr:LytTR family DNA-binding domain-containing protein [Steroidobacteraceae bacterium]
MQNGNHRQHSGSAVEQHLLKQAVALVALTATAVGALHATRLGLPPHLGGAGAGLPEAFIRALGIWWLWALLAPIAFFVAGRWHPERVGLPCALLAHAGGAVLVSMVHSLVYVPVMLTLVWPDLLPQLESVWHRNLIGNISGDLVTYAALAGAWYALDYRRRCAGAPGNSVSPRSHTTNHANGMEDSALLENTGRIRTIVVRACGRVILVSTDDIEWIEASGDYAVLHCRDRQYLANDRLAVLAKKLEPSKFLRVHRSAIVRVDCVCELRPRTHGDLDAILADGTVVRASRTYRSALRQALAARS